MRIRIFAWICPWTIIFLLHIADAGDQQTIFCRPHFHVDDSRTYGSLYVANRLYHPELDAFQRASVQYLKHRASFYSTLIQ